MRKNVPRYYYLTLDVIKPISFWTQTVGKYKVGKTISKMESLIKDMCMTQRWGSLLSTGTDRNGRYLEIGEGVGLDGTQPIVRNENATGEEEGNITRKN